MLSIKRFDLFSRKRFWHLVQARMIISHVLYNHPLYRMNLCQIAVIFERDHTSVIHYLRATTNAERHHPALYDMLRIVYLELFNQDEIPNVYVPNKNKKARQEYRADKFTYENNELK